MLHGFLVVSPASSGSERRVGSGLLPILAERAPSTPRSSSARYRARSCLAPGGEKWPQPHHATAPPHANRTHGSHATLAAWPVTGLPSLPHGLPQPCHHCSRGLLPARISSPCTPSVCLSAGRSRALRPARLEHGGANGWTMPLAEPPFNGGLPIRKYQRCVTGLFCIAFFRQVRACGRE